MELLGKYTFFAEGCRGHLGKQLMEKIRPQPRCRSANLRHRPQGTVEIQPEKHQLGLVIHSGGWPMEPDTWRRLPLPPGKQPDRHRLRRRPQLYQPHLSPYEGIPALQDAPGNPQVPRRRQAHRLRCPRPDCRRPAIAAQTDLPGRGADRRRCRLPQCRPHQGSHCAIKTGALAAEACFDALVAERQNDELTAYPNCSRTAGCTTNSTRHATSSRGWPGA